MPLSMTVLPVGEWMLSHISRSQQDCPLCEFVSQVTSADGKDSLTYRGEDGDELIWLGSHDYSPTFFSTQPEGPKYDYKENGYRIKILMRRRTDVDRFHKWTVIGAQPLTAGILKASFQSATNYIEPEPLTLVQGRKLGTTVAWSMVRRWLRHCETFHSHNGSTSTRPWASCFRLVDVQNRCVVEASMSVRYAALSYVWGDS